MLTSSRRTKLILLVLLVAGSLLVTTHWQRIHKEPIQSWQQDPVADCAVVLTGGAGRIREGLSLLSRKFVRKVIISGVYPDVQFSDLYSASFFMGEVNEQDVILEKRSTTTFGNAQQSVPIVDALGCRDIVLVTSQLHMQRAYATFRSAFPGQFPIYKHTLPMSKSEASWFDVGLEIVKSIFYSTWVY